MAAEIAWGVGDDGATERGASRPDESAAPSGGSGRIGSYSGYSCYSGYSGKATKLQWIESPPQPTASTGQVRLAGNGHFLLAACSKVRERNRSCPEMRLLKGLIGQLIVTLLSCPIRRGIAVRRGNAIVLWASEGCSGV